MIAKISRGSGFTGAGRYLSEKDGAELIGGNMAGRSAQELSSEFGAIRAERQDIARPVWHCSLSLPPGERLSDEQWREISEKHLQNVGIDPERHQYALFRHKDREHDHVHILANRVSYDGEVWHGKWEGLRAKESTQQLEREYGLTRTPWAGRGQRDRLKESRAEKEMQARLGVESPKKQAATRIHEAIKRSNGTREDFEKQCKALGVSVKWNESKTTGRVSGASFALEDAPKGMAGTFKGSQIGKGYTWTRLEEKLRLRESEVKRGQGKSHLEIWQERREQERREQERVSDPERKQGKREELGERTEQNQGKSHLEQYRERKARERSGRGRGRGRGD